MSSDLHDLQSRFLHSLFRQSDSVRAHLNDRSQPRLAIYQTGYLTRLRENLKAVYPALQAHLGEDFFAALARGYIGRHPSAHFSLYDFGARFADFLIETQNGQAGLELPVDIARYERALSQVGRSAAWANDTQPAAPLTDLLAQVRLDQAELTLNPSCQLLELTHDVRTLVKSLRTQEGQTDAAPHPQPEAELHPVHLVLWRVGRMTHADRLEAETAQLLHQSQIGATNTIAGAAHSQDWLKQAHIKGLLRPVSMAS